MHNISAVWPTCQKMACIKYDTQASCHHCREGHFPLEWDGGWCRAFFFPCTNGPNTAFESSRFCRLPAALFSWNHSKLLALWMQTHECSHEVDHHQGVEGRFCDRSAGLLFEAAFKMYVIKHAAFSCRGSDRDHSFHSVIFSSSDEEV